MVERPILFTGPNVCAIQRDENPKTQTRRIPTYMNTLVDGHGVGKKAWNDFDFDFDEAYVDKYPDEGDSPGPYLWVPSKAHGTSHRLYCRVVAGDRLWVREAFYVASKSYLLDGSFRSIEYKADGSIAYGVLVPADYEGKPTSGVYCSFPGRFMPRWASRILLEVIGVRVERVQEIIEIDARAEGCRSDDRNHLDPIGFSAQERFQTLWDSINKKRGHSWDKNDWCWIYEWPPYKGGKA